MTSSKNITIKWLKNNWNKLLIVLFSVTLITSTIFIDYFDQKGEELVNNSMNQALKAFAIAKSLNAAISLAQGTELDPPGLTITIGEVLDPINDLVEQFSWIMLASIVSLGIQKILLNGVVGDIFTYTLIILVIILNIWLFIRFKNDTKLRSLFFKAAIIIIFLRFSIPVMSIVNDFVYENYVAPNYNIEIETVNIKESSEQIDKITTKTIEEKNLTEESFTDKVKSFVDSATSYFSLDYYKNKLEQYQKATEQTSNYILNLIIAFVFNTLFFPLLFLFSLYQLLKKIFNLVR